MQGGQNVSRQTSQQQMPQVQQTVKMPAPAPNLAKRQSNPIQMTQNGQ